MWKKTVLSRALDLALHDRIFVYKKQNGGLVMKAITLEPISRIEGEINLPGSKSLSNRALLLAALAKGTTTVTNLLDSDDIRHMLNALKALGVNYQLSEDKTCCEVEGLGGAFQVENGLSLFLGNAGTAMRPLTAALCLKGQR